ncbi:MAG: flavin monoamine oxidase family protein [Methylococcaceae bacterium]
MARTPLFRKLILALQAARRENLKAQQLPQPIPYSAAGWTRRKFMKTTVLAGVVGLTEGCLSPPAVAMGNRPQPTIAIIGAGLAGMNAAYQLKKAGITSNVYEARSRVGGRVLSAVMGDGLIVDLGAELINTDHADMLALVQDFDIDLFNKLEDIEDLQFPKEAFYFNGVSISESELANDLRLIAAQITADAALLDQDWDTYAPPLDKLSVTDYLNKHADKISQPYIRELLTSMIHTEYGVEADESSALQLVIVLPVVNGETVDLLSYSDERFSVIGGTAKITDALAEELEGQIHLGMSLKEINTRGTKYNLKFSNQSTVEADIVIIAIPFPVLSKISIKAPLSKGLRHFIDEAQLGSNEKVIGSFTSRFWRQSGAFSLAAWGVPGVSEIWDETQREPDRTDGALNFFLGGNEARNAALANATSLGNQFVASLDHFIPGASQASKGFFIKSGWTKSANTLGGYASYKPGQLTRFGSLLWIESDNPAEQQQVSSGNLIFAGEHLSDEYYGFMNGAAQTGRLAASLAIEKMAAIRV